jgi:hypothetical protein
VVGVFKTQAVPLPTIKLSVVGDKAAIAVKSESNG